jgi:nucleoside phosphorylase
MLSWRCWMRHDMHLSTAKPHGGDNTYVVRRIGRYKVVIIRLPGIGPREAANSAATFRVSFTNIRLGLVVGVCGGVPTESDTGHIVMGDVVLSKEVLDFTLNRQHDHEPKIKDTLADRFGRPNREIRGFLATMEGKQDRARLRNKTPHHFCSFLQLPSPPLH